MDALQAVILAAIQGLTEFLPISSSGHLVLPQTLLGWEDQGLAFDVAVHVGSLLAVLAYFYRDVINLLGAWGNSLLTRQQSDDSRLAWMVIVATLPAVVAGLLLNDVIEQHLRGGLKVRELLEQIARPLLVLDGLLLPFLAVLLGRLLLAL